MLLQIDDEVRIDDLCPRCGVIRQARRQARAAIEVTLFGRNIV